MYADSVNKHSSVYKNSDVYLLKEKKVFPKRTICTFLINTRGSRVYPDSEVHLPIHGSRVYPDSEVHLPIAARFLMYSSKDSPEAMAPFLPRELFSADTGVGSLVCALGVPPQAAS